MDKEIQRSQDSRTKTNLEEDSFCLLGSFGSAHPRLRLQFLPATQALTSVKKQQRAA
jgi:hypothetical protein